MNQYTKSTTSQEELIKIITSLEVLEMNYTVRTTQRIINNEWVRGWDIEEYEVSL